MKGTPSIPQKTGLGASCILITCFIFPFIFSGDAGSFERRRPAGHIEVMISGISYEGDEKYRIEITVMNKSAAPITVKSLELVISMQTDSGFVVLDGTKGAGASGRFALDATAEERISVGVRIPLDTRGLFRTFEGDVSLMLRHRLQLTSEKEVRSGESYYWLTPLTGRWVLREGM